MGDGDETEEGLGASVCPQSEGTPSLYPTGPPLWPLTLNHSFWCPHSFAQASSPQPLPRDLAFLTFHPDSFPLICI